MENEDKIKPISVNDFPVITEAVSRSKAYTDKKFESITWLMVGVVIVSFIGFVTLIIDSFHINSITYKEYSEKLDQYNKNQQQVINIQKQDFKK